MGRYQHLVGLAAFTVAMAASLEIASPASAGLQVCNNTSSATFIALGYSAGPDRWQSQGWWTVETGRCRTVLEGNLQPGTYFYLYAINQPGTRIWQGTDQNTWFCVNPTDNFQITMLGNECPGQGISKKIFWEVAVKDVSQIVTLSD